jgi:hypothetical protein
MVSSCELGKAVKHTSTAAARYSVYYWVYLLYYV